MQTFCTLFNSLDVHIIKDVGMLPYAMCKYHGYDSFIATYENGEYNNLKHTPGLRIEFIKRLTGDFRIDSCLWLMKNSKRIDVLNVYHPCLSSTCRTAIYKFFNPSGKVYLKFDGDYNKEDRHFLTKPFYVWQLKHSDLISTEIEERAKTLSKSWGQEIVCVPTPFYPDEIRDYKPFSQRSNVILTVGRLGTKQKATEILLEAFTKICDKIPDWTLKLVGGFEENLNIAADFYAQHPELKARVIFTGSVNDRDELTEIYRDAKIFAFPSRVESFGIVLSEAMLHGCFPVVTNIYTNKALTENFKYALGSEVDDVDGMAGNLLYACKHESEIESLAVDGRASIIERCDLKRIADVIHKGLLL